MQELTVLFSNSFIEIIDKLNRQYDSRIGKILKDVNLLITGYNEILYTEKDLTLPICSVLETVVDEIDKLINDSIRMIDIRSEDFTLSFLPKGKSIEYTEDGKWARKNRQFGKPAKTIRKLLVDKNIKEYEFEEFNNQLKAIVDQETKFQIVSGEDIRHWYNEKQYFNTDSGTLGASCMRHEECKPYFDLYVEHAKMLILTKNDLLIGRALIWELNGKTYLDRIYVSEDYLVNKFTEYASNLKWYIRENQDMMEDEEEMLWLGPEDNYESEDFHNITIKLNHLYEYYPYLDTLRYLDRIDKTISNRWSDGCYFLSDAGGEVTGYETQTCECCGYTENYIDGGESDNIVYSEYEGGYYCHGCVIYSDIGDDYYFRDSVTPYHLNERLRDYILTEDIPFNDEVVEINDEYYSVNHPDVIYDEETETYYIKNER